MLKKLALVMLVMFCITANAHAAKNDVRLGAEIPPIVKGLCSQAGSMSLTFDNATEFRPGLTNTVARLTPGVTLCRDIDFYVVVPDGLDTTGAPKTTGVVQGSFVAAGVGGPVVFRVYGKADGSNNAIEIIPLNGTLTATGPKDQEMKFVFFDNKNATDELLDGRYVSYNPDNGTFYGHKKSDVNASELENSLCVLAEESYAEPYVDVNLESAPKVYTFYQPSARIAIVGKGSPLAAIPPKKELTAEKATTGDQGSSVGTCDKNYETAGGMCETYPAGKFGHFAASAGVPFKDGTYELELEILVNGAVGDHGVYFAADTQGVQLTADPVDLTNAFVPTGALGAIERFVAGGSTTGTPVAGCVARTNEQKIVKMVVPVRLTAADVAGKSYVRFNVPVVAVTDKAPNGAKVALRAALRYGRCNTLFDGTRNLFTLVDKCTTPSSASTLFFPYFAGTKDGYWNGLALVNSGPVEVTATLNIVDESKNKATLDVVIPANGMVVKLVEKLSLEAGFTPDANNTGVMGADRCYISVNATGALNGFAMMADGAQSMGYTVP